MSDWRPMTDKNLLECEDVILACYDKDDPSTIELFRCSCGEHGAFFSKNTMFLSIHEEGWIPFAFRDDDTPTRDDAKFPPLLTDYLTEHRDKN